MVKEFMKLLDILVESMSDGKTFDAFTAAAIAKRETQANEGLNLPKHQKQITFYDQIEQLSDEIKQFIISKGFTVRDSFEFLTRLEKILYEGLDHPTRQ
jgi:hypothetical protein